jgi:hypothetical protein
MDQAFVKHVKATAADIKQACSFIDILGVE